MGGGLQCPPVLRIEFVAVQIARFRDRVPMVVLPDGWRMAAVVLPLKLRWSGWALGEVPMRAAGGYPSMRHGNEADPVDLRNAQGCSVELVNLSYRRPIEMVARHYGRLVQLDAVLGVCDDRSSNTRDGKHRASKEMIVGDGNIGTVAADSQSHPPHVDALAALYSCDRQELTALDSQLFALVGIGATYLATALGIWATIDRQLPVGVLALAPVPMIAVLLLLLMRLRLFSVTAKSAKLVELHLLELAQIPGSAGVGIAHHYASFVGSRKYLEPGIVYGVLILVGVLFSGICLWEVRSLVKVWIFTFLFVIYVMSYVTIVSGFVRHVHKFPMRLSLFS